MRHGCCNDAAPSICRIRPSGIIKRAGGNVIMTSHPLPVTCEAAAAVTGRRLTNKAVATGIANFSSLSPTIQSGPLKIFTFWII